MKRLLDIVRVCICLPNREYDLKEDWVFWIPLFGESQWWVGCSRFDLQSRLTEPRYFLNSRDGKNRVTDPEEIASRLVEILEEYK